MSKSFTHCHCGLLKSFVSDPSVPIYFDKEMNEYYLKCNHDSHLIMTFCFRCGGQLPQSHRSDMFITPYKEEEEDIRTKLSSVRSVEEVIAAIGIADTIDETGNEKEGIRRYLTYESTWKSVSLVIAEYNDGTIDYYWCGKPK
jgi:hypothetical protein